MRYRQSIQYFWTQAQPSSSSNLWQSRQCRDKFAINAKVEGLKSRAAYKLLEINEKHKIFKSGQTVVDLGYAPGSWSQVAIDRTSPDGFVLGIDVIPARPPKGVSTIQGNFLSAAVQTEVKKFLAGAQKDRLGYLKEFENEPESSPASHSKPGNYSSILASEMYFDPPNSESNKEGIENSCEDYMVDVVLSDMSAPWEQTEGFWKRSLSNPYYRMMNTSGINFRDHSGSMDLCEAALSFAFDTLRPGGHLICKYYQGSEDKILESRLKRLFSKVYRDKPESSRRVGQPDCTSRIEC
ncbi:MAG: hypothetical protein Q9219_007576 [cf. Caloplaca sp. 3 TL-2023]